MTKSANTLIFTQHHITLQEQESISETQEWKNQTLHTFNNNNKCQSSAKHRHNSKNKQNKYQVEFKPIKYAHKNYKKYKQQTNTLQNLNK